MNKHWWVRCDNHVLTTLTLTQLASLATASWEVRLCVTRCDKTQLVLRHTVITIAIPLRYDYDTTTIRLRRKSTSWLMDSLYHKYCDSTTLRLRYDDTTTHSTTTEVIEITIRLRYDYDKTTTYRARLLPLDAIRREQKISMSIFRRSCVVVVSQSNRNCDIGYRSDHTRRARSAGTKRCSSMSWRNSFVVRCVVSWSSIQSSLNSVDWTWDKRVNASWTVWTSLLFAMLALHRPVSNTEVSSVISNHSLAP